MPLNYTGIDVLYFDIAEIACITAQILIVRYYLENLFQKREQSTASLTAFYGLLWFCLVCFSIWPSTEAIRFVLLLSAIWLFGMLLYDGGYQGSLLTSLLLCSIWILMHFLVAQVMAWFGINVRNLTPPDAFRTIYLAATHILLYGVSVLLVRMLRGCLAELAESWGHPISVVASILIPLIQILLIGIYPHGNWLPFLILMTVISLLVFIFTQLHARTVQAEQDAAVAEHHYAMQQKYYEQLRAQQEETLAIWHDISKYLRAIRTEENDTSLMQIQQMLNAVNNVVDVNNRVVSVILNEYVQKAKQSEVLLELDVQVPSELFVTAADLYVLIGNTMDNALEACADLPADQRRILLKLRVHNSILFYCIENPYAPQHQDRFRDRYHGYGLKNVRKCVERYGGMLDIQKDSGTFRVSAHLNSM